MDSIQSELAELKREILELKTSQRLPGFSRMFQATYTEPVGSYDGIYAWTITFEDPSDTNAPIVIIDQGFSRVLLPYDPLTNTQKIEYFAIETSTSVPFNYTVYSTRPIASVSPLVKTGDRGEYTPPTPATWTQVRTFDHNDMGTTQGWCLMNCRLGFGIQSGTFASAIADMRSQRANGTLHGAGTTPPSYLQVPVYIDTGTVDGHVVVWDKGTVWSDGTRISQGLSYYGLSNVWGWGELCDGVRVVRRS